MKSDKSPNQDQWVQNHGLYRARPIRPEDMGTETLGCSSCGTVFLEGGTVAWIVSFGDVFCPACGIWSRGAATPPE
jgi:hypothetical protein